MPDGYTPMSEARKCRHCGGQLELVSIQGPMEFTRCSSCEREQVFLGTPSSEELIKSAGPRGTLKVIWGEGKPNAKQVHALRQLVPELLQKPVPEALTLLRGRTCWAFEGITRAHAKELGQKAISLGLEVRTEFPDTQC